MPERNKETSDFHVLLDYDIDTPFTTENLQSIAEGHGFEPEDAEGTEYSKNGQSLFYNTDAGSLFLEVLDFDQAADSLRQLHEIDSDLESTKDVFGYAVRVDMLVQLDYHSGKLLSELVSLPDSGSSLLEDGKNHRLNIQTSLADPETDRPELTDLKIETYFENPQYLYLRIVHRDTDYEETISFLSELESNIDELIDDLELEADLDE